MTKGAYKVVEDADNRTIKVDLTCVSGESVPADQIELVQEINRTLTVLQMLFPQKTDSERFLEYFRPLVSIARDGLEDEDAKPDIARRALVELQSQVTTREAGRVKHRYMKRLAKYACTNSAAWFCVAIGFLIAQEIPLLDWPVVIQSQTIACFFLLLSGCSAGVWLSFGARRTTLTFYELHIPEPDQLHPAMRVAFVMALTVILSLLFHHKVISLGIGELTSSAIYQTPTIAWLVGALCGFGEQLLSTQISEQASRFLSPRKYPVSQ